MHPAKLKKDGSLEDVYHPSIYVDTNFLRSYFNAEGAEFYVDEHGNPISPPWEEDMPSIPHHTPSSEDLRNKLIFDLIKPKENWQEYGIIRHWTTKCLSEASLIMTPIALLELYKIDAEVVFKNQCAISLGAKHIQRMGDKEVGKYLSDLYLKLSFEDTKDDAVKELVDDCVFNMSFARGHGLQGIFYISDLNFRMSEGDIGSFLWVLAFLQFEAADIMHLHAAKLLGCEYFASLDKALSKNKEIIKKSAGIQILSNPKEVIAILKKHRKKDA